MRWRDRRRSSNIEDRRSARGTTLVGGGIGTIVIVLAAMYFGIDPSFLLEGVQSVNVPSDTATTPGEQDFSEDPLADMVAVVVADTEDVWNEVFAASNQRYQEPVLVMFRGATRTACGVGQAFMGPFYCPADSKAYIDLDFYTELKNRFDAPGDFAQAYVIAHEIGHHVQHLLGITDEVHRSRQRLSEAEANRMSVRLELQADCLAGVWANRTHRRHNFLEEGDVEEALNAASAIGDDRLQQGSGRGVSPDSFTHGTSEQRVRWFRTGLEHGDPERCDTFAAQSL
ncbi:MAG TPA: neutral zinc metallopeptidase [Woeseiaceae bacterium]|nr:neutral zinc metallopeptidase [Woeseiaceae bacterium]